MEGIEGGIVAECPHCKRPVDEDLVYYGGTCPLCLSEIHGEEAPTDPGEEVKAQFQAEIEATKARRQNMPIYAVGAALAVVVAVAVVVLWPQPEPMDFGEILVPFEAEWASAEDPEAEKAALENGGEADEDEETEQVAASRPSRSGSKKPTLPKAGSATNLRPSDQPTLGGDAVADAGSATRTRTAAARELPSGDRDIGALTTSSGSVADAGLDGLAVGPSRRRAKLHDEDEIRRAVNDMLRDKVRSLSRCKERALNADEGYRGKWRVSAMVTTQGTLDQTAAELVAGDENAELQTCILQQMAKWKMAYELAKPQPIGTVLTF